MNCYHKLPLLLLLILSLGLQAQDDLPLHFLDEVSQSRYSNPARLGEHHLSISLPGVSAGFYNSAFTLGEFLEGDSLEFDIQNIIAQLDEENYLNWYASLEWIAAEFKLGPIMASVSVADKFNLALKFPKALAEFADDQTALFLNSPRNVAPSLNTTQYREFAIGAAITLDKFSVGARLKYLNGLINISSKDNSLLVGYNDSLSQFEVNSDLGLSSSIPIETSDYFLSSSVELSDVPFFTQNHGFAIDMGVNYQATENLSLSLSLSDLGSIKWTEFPKQYRSQGSFSIDSIGLASYHSGGSFDQERLWDTLEKHLDFQESLEPYSTAIPNRLYLSGVYQLAQDTRLGLAFHGQTFDGLNGAMTLGVNQKFGPLHAGLSYSMRKSSYDNLGASLLLQAGPVQFFLMTDDALSIAKPKRSNNFHFRTGLNLVFLKNKAEG